MSGTFPVMSCVLAMFVASTPAAAQELPPSESALLAKYDIPRPSSNAVILANEIEVIAEHANGAVAKQQRVDVLMHGLFTTAINGHNPCDRKIAQCENMARSMSEQYLSQTSQSRTARTTAFRAVIIDELMSDEQIKEAIPFVKSSAGRQLAAVLMFSNARGLSEPLSGKMIQASLDLEGPKRALAAQKEMGEAFYAATEKLPRAPQGISPAAPPPSPQFRKPQ